MKPIRRLITAAGLAALAVSATGCFNAAKTRLPSVGLPPDPVERQSLQRFDPFPDQSIGPDTDSRPRDFQSTYGDQRRLTGTDILGPVAPQSNSLPLSDYRYDNSVR
ncbi:hypothetical protein [Stratiformator vulcanicus]|nr:hypothetical protein [Stratiformator vulcanicus]